MLVGLLLQAHSVTSDHQPECGLATSLATSPNTYRTACAEVVTGTYTQVFKGCGFLKQNLEWEETQPHSHRHPGWECGKGPELDGQLIVKGSVRKRVVMAVGLSRECWAPEATCMGHQLPTPACESQCGCWAPGTRQHQPSFIAANSAGGLGCRS